MAQLIYFTIASLDGYIEDEDGKFDWAEPTEEVHAFVNDLMRPVGTYLYGRRMYETMTGWETDPSFASGGSVEADFAAIWQAADKVVYSTTLTAPATKRTRVERTFDPACASDDDVSGPRPGDRRRGARRDRVRCRPGGRVPSRSRSGRRRRRQACASDSTPTRPRARRRAAVLGRQPLPPVQRGEGDAVAGDDTDSR